MIKNSLDDDEGESLVAKNTLESEITRVSYALDLKLCNLSNFDKNVFIFFPRKSSFFRDENFACAIEIKKHYIFLASGIPSDI